MTGTFEATAKQVWTSKVPLEIRACPDRYIGKISLGNAKHDEFSEFVVPGTKPNDSDRRLILVLESPHKDEYFGLKHPLPANGQTGRNIRSYLGDVLKSCDVLKTQVDGKAFEVFVVNAVPYQCSQAEELTDISNRINCDLLFRKMFRSHGDLADRINTWVRPKHRIRVPDIVINCCTKGVGKRKLLEREPKVFDEIMDSIKAASKYSYLRDIVHEELRKTQEASKDYPYDLYAASHPAAWGRGHRSVRRDETKLATVS